VGQVRIVHPFRPLCGQRFTLVNARHNWGEDRMDYREPDPVVAVSAGRSPFCLQDLVELTRLLQRLHDPVSAGQGREVRRA
jgi:hypothetical protein